MNCPLDRTDAVGFSSDSVGSGVPAGRALAGRVDSMGGNIYHLTRTAPTA